MLGFLQHLLGLVVPSFVRGLCIATVQYSSLCGCALGWILGGFDIVEVVVQDREQADSREQVEERERKNTNTKRQPTNAQTCDIMDGMWMEWMRTLRHLEPQSGVCTRWKCSRNTLMWGVSVYTHRRLQWIVIDCKRNQLQQQRDLNNSKKLWAHFQFHSDLSHHDVLEEGCHLLYCSGEIGSSTCSPDSRCRRFLIETAALKSDRSFIGPCLPDLFKVRYHLSLVSSPFLWSKFTSMVFFCKFVQLFALLFCPSDCVLCFTTYWISEKSIVNTCKMFTLRVDFLAASLPRIPGYMVLFFVLRSCRVEHHGCVLYLSRSSGKRVHPVVVCWIFFWIRCQSSIVRKCSTQFLDPNKEDSENIVLLVKFRTTRITSHYPNRGSSPSNFSEWVVDEYLLLDEDDFRSLLQALELGDVLLLLQLHVTVLVHWNQFCAPLLDPPIQVSPYLLGLWLHHVSLDYECRDQTWYVPRFSLSRHIRVSPYLIIGFWVLVRFVGCLCCFQQYQNPNRTSNYLCRKFSVVVEVTHIPSGI